MNNISAVLYGSEYMGMREFSLNASQNFNMFLVSEYKEDVWETFLDWVGSQPQNAKKHKVDVFIIDKINKLYEACVDYVCEQEEVEHPSMAGSKKPLIWKFVKKAMTDALYDFASLPGDKFFIADEKTITLNSSLFEGTFYCPKFDWVLEDIMPDIVNQTLFFTTVYRTTKNNKGKKIRKENQIIISQPRPDVFAGDHMDKLPRHIKGKNVKEMYKNYERYMSDDNEEKE